MKKIVNVFCLIDRVESIRNLKDTLTNIAPELDEIRSMVYVYTTNKEVYVPVRNQIKEWLFVNDYTIPSLVKFSKVEVPPVPRDSGLLFVYQADATVVSGNTFQKLAEDMLYRPTAGFITALSPDLDVSYRFTEKSRDKVLRGEPARVSKRLESTYDHYFGELVRIDYPPMGTFITRNGLMWDYGNKKSTKQMAEALMLYGYASYLDLGCAFTRREN